MDHSREKLLDFAALCLWLILSAAMAFYVFFQFGQDFRGYYAAARVLLEGGNPYDYNQVARVLVDVTGRAGNNPFYYPLWFGWFIGPLSLLPFQTARAIWMIFNWALWLFGLIRLQNFLDYPHTGWRTWLLNVVATFLFAWTTWKFEQTGILLFVIVLEALIAHERQQWSRMGIFLALALIKPNVMLLPVVVLSIWLIRSKNWRPVLVALGVLGGLVLITTVLTPDWYRPFFEPHFGQGLTDVLDGPNEVTGTRLNTTLLDWLKWLGIPPAGRYTIYGVVAVMVAAVLVRGIWKSKSIMEMAVIALLVSFAITPYTLQYDFPPLVMVLFWALATSRHAGRQWVPILIVVFITSVLIWERPISDGYWIVIGLSALAYWACTRAGMLTQQREITS